jgi:hypothetical protein
LTRSGQPLKFLGTTVLGWTALRLFLLWPAAPMAGSVVRTVLPFASAAPSETVSGRLPLAMDAPVPLPYHGPAPGKRFIEAAKRQRLVALAITGLRRFGEIRIGQKQDGSTETPRSAPAHPRSFAASAPVSQVSLRKPWSVDLWLVARGGSDHGAGFGGGELGGSQAGARFAYALDRRRRLAAYARFDTPLSGSADEAAFGFDWRPTALPVRAVVETRVPLDGSRAVAAAGLVGGLGPIVEHGLRLEGYGQAGIVSRNGGEGFADGAIRATRSIGALAGINFDLGGGAWGGAQRGASRLDLGPTLGATIPIATHAIRIAVDWRGRVAGHARPGSGPALTIGASF